MMFLELSCYATPLVTTDREIVCRFVEGLNYSLKFGMARKMETEIAFHQVVEIYRRLQHIRRLEREVR